MQLSVSLTRWAWYYSTLLMSEGEVQKNFQIKWKQLGFFGYKWKKLKTIFRFERFNTVSLIAQIYSRRSSAPLILFAAIPESILFWRCFTDVSHILTKKIFFFNFLLVIYSIFQLKINLILSIVTGVSN